MLRRSLGKRLVGLAEDFPTMVSVDFQAELLALQHFAGQAWNPPWARGEMLLAQRFEDLTALLAELDTEQCADAGQAVEELSSTDPSLQDPSNCNAVRHVHAPMRPGLTKVQDNGRRD